MIFKRTATRRGFTLVELLLVIVLISILMALVTLSGFNMMESTNAQTETRRIIRTVHSLRSAWLAHYADTQKMIGIGAWTGDIEGPLSRYSDRNLADEKSRYGTIRIIENGRGTYIGFDASTGEIWSKSASTSQMIKSSLLAQENDYELLIEPRDENSRVNGVYIRIK